MIEFTHTLLASLISQGYKSIIYTPSTDHGVLKPSHHESSDDFLNNMESYQIPITDLQVVEMAGGVEEFKFYISEEHFK